MERHLVHRVSRLFPSSFTSCQLRSVPDVVESSVSIPKTTKIIHDSTAGGTAFPRMYRNPSLSNPKDPPKIPKNNDCEVPKKHPKKTSLLAGPDAEGRRCSPVTSLSVMASELKVKASKDSKINLSSSSNSGWFSSDDQGADFDGESDAFFSLSTCSSKSSRLKIDNTSGRRFDKKSSTDLGRCSSGLSAKSEKTIFTECSVETTKRPADKHRKSARNPTEEGKKWHRKGNNQSQFVIKSQVLKGCEVVEAATELYYGNYSGSNCRKTTKTRQRTGKNRRRNARTNSADTSDRYPIVVDDRLEESYAVEKSSSDPYGDFRTSIVEMILEKQIFGANDLEKLLHCFLSLNSPYYHRIIVEVFTEICDTLFSY